MHSLDAVRRKGQGLRLRLRIEQLPLAALPWEFTLLKQAAGEPDAPDFLCLQRDVSITRYGTLGITLKPLDSKDRIRIVIALANPDSDPPEDINVEADKRVIQSAIRGVNATLGESAVEAAVIQPATRKKLLEAIAGTDILHFAGHGRFTAAGRDLNFTNTGQIVLETEDGREDPFDSDQLAQLLTAQDIRLVVLGACSTAARDSGATWSGVAPALVRGNIPAVVAMQFKVDDIQAAGFVEMLYSHLLAGCTIDEAVSEGRRAMFAAAGGGDTDWAKMRDWGVPVLYLRAPDGLLFPLETETNETCMDRGSALVRIRQKAQQVNGKLLGIGILESRKGKYEVFQETQAIGPNGSVVGIDRVTDAPTGSRSKRATDRDQEENK